MDALLSIPGLFFSARRANLFFDLLFGGKYNGIIHENLKIKEILCKCRVCRI